MGYMKIKTRRYYIYNLAVVGGFLGAILPRKLGFHLANFAGKIGFSFAKKERNKAISALKMAFPEKSDSEIKKIAEKIFINLCKYIIELLNIYKLNKNNLEEWIKPEGFEKVERALAKGKGVLMLSSHFGNWDLQAMYFSLTDHPIDVIARRIYFNKYDDFINRVRRSKGMGIIFRDESPKKILRSLKQNKAIGILADQDIDSVDGVFVDFFGKPAYTAKAPVALSLVSGAPILPCFTVRDGTRYRFIIEDPVEIEERSTKEETIRYNTQKWTRVLEKYIRKYPDHWVWMHRRWKTRPEMVNKK